VIDAAEKSRRGSGWLPLSDPRYAAPEYRRVARLSLLGSAAVWIPLYLLSSFSAISAGSAVLYAASLGVVLLIAVALAAAEGLLGQRAKLGGKKPGAAVSPASPAE